MICPAADSRPNILFLFTDDQRFDTIHALGNAAIQTPNLDRLARDGFVFTNAYCLGGNVPAVCRPSRNMLLSGRVYFRWEGPLAPADKPNLPDALNRAGYTTYHHGKRGNTALDIHKRFDVSKYLADDQVRRSGQPGKIVVDEAIDFLRQQGRNRRFLLYLAFATPHDPRVAAPEDLERYKESAIPLPANFMPVHPFDNGEMTIRDELLAPWPRTAAEVRHQLHDYYAVITGLDQNIGRLLAALDELGLKDNTIVIFSSDNGLALGSHGLMGKQNLYEHSAKVPLFLCGPGIPQGRSEALVYLLDLFPTICELTRTQIPEGLDGISLVPIISQQRDRVRDTLFMAYRDVQRAVRDPRWKLIHYPKINRTQLFDLAADPHELNDLSEDPDHAERIERLTVVLKDWQKRFGDDAPLSSEKPQDDTFVPPKGEALKALRARYQMDSQPEDR
jgi:arylsulfatase A-like enzyme